MCFFPAKPAKRKVKVYDLKATKWVLVGTGHANDLKKLISIRIL